MDPTQTEAAKARNIAMLEDASDLEVTVENGQIKVRVINMFGHVAHRTPKVAECGLKSTSAMRLE